MTGALFSLGHFLCLLSSLLAYAAQPLAHGKPGQVAQLDGVEGESETVLFCNIELVLQICICASQALYL